MTGHPVFTRIALYAALIAASLALWWQEKEIEDARTYQAAVEQLAQIRRDYYQKAVEDLRRQNGQLDYALAQTKRRLHSAANWVDRRAAVIDGLHQFSSSDSTNPSALDCSTTVAGHTTDAGCENVGTVSSSP